MDNLQPLATSSTQDTGQINVRENRRGNQEWTIYGHLQHWHQRNKTKKQHRKLKQIINISDEISFK